MTVKQLIERLQQLGDQYTDFPVCVWQEWGPDVEIDSVAVAPSDKIQGVMLPDRVRLNSTDSNSTTHERGRA